MVKRSLVGLSAGRFVVRRFWVQVLALGWIQWLAPPAMGRSIGPDAFGYRATDSVLFAFEDISATGAGTLGGTDDGTFTAPIGFPFSFYGASFTTVSWSSNGLLTFGGTNSQAANGNLAVSRTVGDRPSIAVLWDDWQFLDTRAGAVYFETRGAPGSRRFIVQWKDAFTYDASVDGVTFQVILFEGSNHILFQYLDVDSGDAGAFGSSATVGVRDTGGQTNGRNLVWSFNNAAITPGLAIRIATSLDSAPPMVSISSPADGGFTSAAEVLLVAAVQDESETSVTSSPPGVSAVLPPGGGTVNGSLPLLEGVNVLAVSAVDSAGNVGGSSVTVVRDSTPPVLSGVTPPDGSVLGESPIVVRFTVSDATATTVTIGSSMMAMPDGGGVMSGVVSLVEGETSVAIVATDSAGNTATVVVRFILDSSAPLVSIDAPAGGTCFGPGESPAGVVVTINDTTETTVTSSVLGISGLLPAGGGVLAGVQPLVEGPNEITVTATDSQGRTSSASVTVVLDASAPLVTLDSPADGTAVRGSIEIHASAVDALLGCGLARVELLVDGAVTASLSSGPFTAWVDTTGLTDGPHDLAAKAIDARGNAAVSTARVLVDNTPPSTAFLEPTAGSHVSGMISYSAQASDGTGSGLALLEVLAGGLPPSTSAAAAYDPPRSSDVMSGQEDTTRWPDGPLVLSVRAVDAAGNEAQALVSVMVENLGDPAITITPPDGSVVSGVLPITVEVSGMELAALELLADGVLLASSDASPLSASFDTTHRLDGALTLRVVARSTTGQVISASAEVTVDNLSIRLMPACLPLKACGRGIVLARVCGESANLLFPLQESRVRLLVPGGSPVPAIMVGRGRKGVCREAAEGRVILAFERSKLVASIQAGIAAGAIEPGSSVEVALVAEEEAVLGTSFISLRARGDL